MISLFEKIRPIIALSLIFIIGGFLIAGGVVVYYIKNLPSPQDLANLRVVESTKIYDRTGTVLLYDIYNEQKRTIISPQEIPSSIQWATIVAENDTFYSNFGVDIKGIARALLENVKERSVVQGGSTITQQFVKNAFLTPEQTISRKIKELILTLELEWRYSKDQILTWYLNQVPYGSNAYGVEAASQTYFGKHAKNLTIAESALLASLPKAPTYYSPYGNHPEDLLNRQRYILARMLKFNHISQKEYDDAIKEKLVFQKQQGSLKAPHFVLYVKEYLESVYGPEYLQSAGLTVRTTIDWDFQKKAEEMVMDGAAKNIRFRGSNAALVAIDPKTGQILVMVGSKDYFGEQSPNGCVSGKNCAFDPNVNISTRPRQPGSSFKPFAYSQAFIKGYTPNTVLFDVPTEFNVNCAPDSSQDKDQYGLDCYNPQNYNGKFRGPITMKEALAQSINIPAIETLYLAGIPETINLAKKMGIHTLQNPNQYGLSLVLGGGEVTLLDETSAYGVFANSGVYLPATSILSVTNAKGEVIEQYAQNPQTVLDKTIADQISGILSSDDLRAPVFGQHGNLYTPNISTAVKTGTTQKYRDAWTVGYTTDVVVGVWVGNNDGTYMTQGGVNAAAPIWNKAITYVYDRQIKNSGFSLSDSSPLPSLAPTQTGVPILDGVLAGLQTPDGIYHSLLYFLDKDNPRGQGNSQNDPQFSSWETAVSQWVQDNPLPSFSPVSQSPNPPQQTSGPITITLLSPTQYRISRTTQTSIEVIVTSSTPLKSLRVQQENQVLFTRDFSSQNTTSFSTDLYLTFSSQNTKTSIVKVEAKNQSHNTLSKSFSFVIE